MMALGDDEQLQVMRYWVSEANRAMRIIAFIRGFEKARKQYFERKYNLEEPKNPAYSAVGRVSIALLDVALDSLILFSFRAFDGDYRAASLSKLKNAFLLSDLINDRYKEQVKYAFRKFDRGQKSAKSEIEKLRSKMIAHVDFDFLLDGRQEGITIEKALEIAENIVDLVSFMAAGFKKPGTIESPTISDNSLVITPAELAEPDAEEFWRVTFSCWAK